MKLLLVILVFLYITRSLVLGAFSALKQLRASFEVGGKINSFPGSNAYRRSNHDPGASSRVSKKDIVITLSAQDVKITEE
jgi:hypothetical protein